jgi:hypothetical protein
MAYLGQVVLASSTFATLRDMAGYGATLLFDDAERIMDPKNGDPDKQALLLAGNRKGSMIALKEQIDKKWVTRHVPSYCPRAFSAIGLPIDTMASRTIFIPVVASADARKSNSDPLDYESWPDGIDRDRLIDDLWLTALFHGSKLSAHDRKVAASGSTHGRSFQPWRAIHAVASWLEGEGIEGLRDRMAAAMTAYHGDELLNSMRGGRTIVIRGLSRMVDHRLKTDPTLGENREIVFRTRELVEYVDAVAYEEDLIGKDENYITSRSMGWHLKKMRLRRPSTRSADAREWAVTAQEVAVRRSSLLGQTLGENVTNDRNGRNDTSEAESSDVSAVSDICDVFPGGISMPDELRHKLASFVPKNRMAEVVDNFRDDLDDLAAMPFEQMQTIVLKFLAPTEGASQ